MDKNTVFCLELYIYSFFNQQQRPMLQLIDTDLNSFLRDSCRFVGVIGYYERQQLKSFEVKSFVYKICGLSTSHQNDTS